MNNFTLFHGDEQKSIEVEPPFNIYDILNLNESSQLEKSYEINTSFTLSKDQLQADYAYLSLEGVYTYATIVLNNQIILETNNAFRTYRIPLKGILRDLNLLSIKFTPVSYFLDSTPLINSTNGIITAQSYVRDRQEDTDKKVLGMAKGVVLTFENDISINNSKTTQSINKNTGHIENKFSLISGVKSPLSIQQRLERRRIVSWYVVDSVNVSNINASKPYTFTSNYKVEDPYFFTSPILGNSKLRLITEIFNEDKLIKRIEEPLYFQAYQIVSREVPRLSIDNRFEFMKGINWETVSPFDARSDIDYRIMFELLSQLNNNFIRVKGSSSYEDEVFYTLAESMNVFIWQDLMFSDMVYPDDHSFIENIGSEIRQQVNRLNRHPSVIAYSGNEKVFNKLDGLEKGLSRSEFIKIVAIQNRLFKDIIPQIINTYSPRVYYAVSVPHTSGMKELNTSMYKAEQEVTSVSAIDLYTPKPYMLNYGYGIKSMDHEFSQDHNSIYISQLNQALKSSMFIQQSVGALPKYSGVFMDYFYNPEKSSSPSIINADMTPKLAFYEISKAFESITVNYSKSNSEKPWKIVSNYTEPFTADLSIYEVNPKTAKFTALYVDREIQLRLLENLNLSTELPKLQDVKEENLIVIELKYANKSIRNTFIPSGDLGSITIPQKNDLQIKSQDKGDKVELTITSDGLNPWVQLKSDKSGFFSENCITLLPGEERIIYFYPYTISDQYNFSYISYTTEFISR